MRRESLFPLGPPSVAGIRDFTYPVNVRITASLDDKLVEKLRKIALDQHTTLSGLIPEQLEKIAAEDAATSARKGREHVALERSFEKFRFRTGKRMWKREDLHERR